MSRKEELIQKYAKWVAVIAKLEEAALNAQSVLEEAVNADILISGTTIRDEAVTAIILLGEAIEANEVQA